MSDKNLEKFLIDSRATIFQALEAINDNWQEVIFVLNEDKQLIGVITDGDIRRGLLRGVNLKQGVTEIMNGDFFSVPAGTEREIVLDQMKARGIRQVPILDESQRIKGVHFLRELIDAEPKPNAALIMAGGRGSRLRPFTEHCPKPLLKIAGRPILERILFQLTGSGIREFYIAVNYLGNMIEDYFGNGERYGCRIRYLREDEPLGTAGALSLMPTTLTHPFLVLNGDILTNVAVGRLLEFHAQTNPSATIVASTHNVQVPFGVIEVDGDRLKTIAEKPIVKHLINSGVYVLDPMVIKYVPQNQPVDMPTLLTALVSNGKNVSVFRNETEWMDVGTPLDLEKARGLV